MSVSKLKSALNCISVKGKKKVWIDNPPCSFCIQASQKIEDAKLARDFQTTLQEFQKVQQLASERELAYTPASPSSTLPIRSMNPLV